MPITRIQLLSVPVSDQDRALDFYTRVLGFTLVTDTAMGPDMRWVLVAPPGGGTMVTLVTWFPTMAAGSLKGTVLETDTLEADAAAIAATGVTVSPVEDAPWGRFVTFDDPDGNGIVLQASSGFTGAVEQGTADA